MTNDDLYPFQKFIYTYRSKDLSCFSRAFLSKIIQQRTAETNSLHPEGYLVFLEHNPSEIDLFLHSLNVSYSQFFRSPIDYAILGDHSLPELWQRKAQLNSVIRIWSAACADGQEPYSLAITMEDYLKRAQQKGRYSILATDISPKALSHAQKGEYGSHSVQNVTMAQLTAHFTQQGECFMIHDDIKRKVEFAQYDILDEHTKAPPSAIFCGFDIIVCCNLLIYYNGAFQNKILTKLYHDLSPEGYLMVDESERERVKAFHGFQQYAHLGNIFIKK